MSKSKTAEMATASTNQQDANGTQTAEQQKATADLNAKSEESAPPAPVTRESLVQAKNDLKKAYGEATDEATERKLAADVYKATLAIDKWDADIKAEADKKAAMEKLETSKNVIAESFGITREKLDEVLNTKPSDEQGRANPVFAAITTVFGKPVVYAKQGQTGKQLTSGNSSSSDKPAGGTKYAEILSLMEQGKSYNDILAAGYGDGTIRTVATDNGFVKSTKGDNASPYVKKG